MRIAHSGTSNLKNLPNLPKIDPRSAPWTMVTFVVRNWIFIVLTLHARSYQCGMNQHLALHTLVTLTCQIQVEICEIQALRVNLYWLWGCRVTPITSNVLLVYGLTFRCVFPYNLVTLMFNYMVWTYAGRSQRDVKLETFSKFADNWPVQRAPKKGKLCSPEQDIYSTYSTCT